MESEFRVSTKEGFRKLIVGSYSDQGWHRKSNEDVCMVIHKDNAYNEHSAPYAMFGIFDGHGGPGAAKYMDKFLPGIFDDLYIRQKQDVPTALSTATAYLDEKFVASGDQSGSTALVIVMTPDGQLTVSNVGDSEGILGYLPIRPNDVAKFSRPLIRMETLCPLGPHNPRKNPFEALRVTSSGGFLQDGRLLSSLGNGQMMSLAVSRAIGDAKVKLDQANKGSSALISSPDFYERILTGFEDFIILASDGLWDVLDYSEVFTLTREFLKHTNNPTEVAQKLTKTAYDRGSTDNVSVIVILFR